ncbi:hypothetical protein Q9L58_001692 [Maublancomyces gigas]|uniref:Uncharacterized protein n=1 Tax=Discina gigas TaxID=1032678 RepID=A0ABR3GTI6_9PEZI
MFKSLSISGEARKASGRSAEHNEHYYSALSRTRVCMLALLNRCNLRFSDLPGVPGRGRRGLRSADPYEISCIPRTYPLEIGAPPIDRVAAFGVLCELQGFSSRVDAMIIANDRESDVIDDFRSRKHYIPSWLPFSQKSEARVLADKAGWLVIRKWLDVQQRDVDLQGLVDESLVLVSKAEKFLRSKPVVA